MKNLLIPFVLGAAIATGGVAPAAAQTTADLLAPIVTRLEAEGYEVVDSHRSWLGRLVVVSTKGDVLREVVLNRATGTVLSDRLFDRPGHSASSGGENDNGGASRNGSNKGATAPGGGQAAGRN